MILYTDESLEIIHGSSTDESLEILHGSSADKSLELVHGSKTADEKFNQNGNGGRKYGRENADYPGS